MAQVGFIGLGNMGGGMARNILKAGHSLKVFDLNDQVVSEICAEGAVAATSATDAATDVDAVITMLPAGKHVKSVYLGDGGLIAVARSGTVMMDCSTIDVDSAREVVAAATDAGMRMVDAPVSGGVAAAAAGTLTFMVGGAEEAFAAAKPYLDDMGANIIHAGKAGSGQAAKICNNMMLGIQMISVAEAFVLAEKLGLEAEKLFNISSKASGQCWSLTSYCPVPGPVPTSPANNDYKAGFAAAMMLKDLRLAQEAASSAGAETPLGKMSRDLYEKFAAESADDMDFSGIINMLRD
ncbi:3-hydroxyisobutyrate dehydrogenase [Paremcibacter congregatus]|uniref:3-hydroxyisobutyrate dehydrogenase n=1 Tax=Paremcibacter congregatus TaxID=2043170 RepID=A0A2G4YPY1_9PROT|nr:3-hydroxyisobutyrate dehydrogenase [Paremcibacter congregatus]PHZ84340.1 3-hydroxyisobutyrate dehydrogenase [Paremcibacter congregatus]QDE28560.1 3-hydroxyisobutyrate dehydrogenase [Paremcibacter congregatus]